MVASEDSRLDGVRDDYEILIKDMDLATITTKSVKSGFKVHPRLGWWNIVYI